MPDYYTEAKNAQETNHKTKQDSSDNIYKLHGHISLSKAFFFGFQHVVAMFVGNLTPILMVAAVAKYGGQAFTDNDTANLVQATMLAAGIATLMQVYPIWKIGSRLPIVMGASFSFVGGALVLAANDFSILIGAIIVSGILEGLMGFCVPIWRKYITPTVSGVVILSIGISLLGTCMDFFVGGKAPDAGSWVHITIATITLIACLFAQNRFTGFWQQSNILFGLAVGYACAVLVTATGLCPLVDLTATKISFVKQGLFSCPRLFPYTPTFELGSIIVFTIICLTSAVQTIGTIEATCCGVLHRAATEREIGGAVSCDGFANTVIGWLFGCCPVTTYEQNIGVLMVSKAVNLSVITAGAFILITAGLIPSLGVFLASLPSCVLGGSLVMVFGSIVYVGIKMIYEAGLNERNALIASVALCIGLGSSHAPKLGAYLSDAARDLLLSTPVTSAFIVAVLLTILLPTKSKIDEANSEAIDGETNAQQELGL